MKALLYCKKVKPYLADFKGDYQTYSNGKELDELFDKGFNPNDIMSILNGKIVAECDIEVEKIVFKHIHERDKFGILHNESWYEYKGLNVTHYECDLASKSGFKDSSFLFDFLFDYLVDKEGYPQDGYAIHIKNLHIFNRPLELNRWTVKAPKVVSDIICDSCTNFGFNCKKCEDYWDYYPLEKAPNNVRIVYDQLEKRVFIPISSSQMCKALNEELTVIVKKYIPKEIRL